MLTAWRHVPSVQLPSPMPCSAACNVPSGTPGLLVQVGNPDGGAALRLPNLTRSLSCPGCDTLPVANQKPALVHLPLSPMPGLGISHTPQ